MKIKCIFARFFLEKNLDLNLELKTSISTSYKTKGFTRALRLATLVVLFAVMAVQSVCAQNYNDCTATGHPIYVDTLWRFPDTVCAGQTVPFSIGYDTSNTIVLSPNEPPIPEPPAPVYIPGGDICGDSCYIRSYIFFPPTYSGYITSADNIDYIRLNIEHEYPEELYIKVVCPSGQSATILNCNYVDDGGCWEGLIPTENIGWQPGNNVPDETVHFGIQGQDNDSYPCDPNRNAPGFGWDYCWTSSNNHSTSGYIYNINNMDANDRLIATNLTNLTPIYSPDQSFNSLIGCQISGNWYIEIVDASPYYNGYLFDWEIVFDESLAGGGGGVDSAAVLTTIQGTLTDDPLFVPQQPNSDTSFVFTAPVVAQNTVIEDTLRVFDPVAGCWYDTVLRVTVLAAGDSTMNVTICHADLPYSVPGNGIAFSGKTFNATGVYKDTIPGAAANGCDSIVTLNLIVIEEPNVNISTVPGNATICAGESITLTAESDCSSGTILHEDFSSLSSVCADCDDINYTSPGAPGGYTYELSNATYASVLPNFPTRSNVYPAGDAIKLGKGIQGTENAYVGSITSIPLDLSRPFALTLSTKGWGDKRGKVVVSVDNGINEQSFITSNDDWPGTYTSKTLYFPAATNQSTITIHTDTILPSSGNIEEGYRFFIDDILINRQCHYLWNTNNTDTNATLSVSPEESISYTVTITGDYGCFSTASQEVTVNHPNNTAQQVIECGSYTWHGTTYNESGTYYYSHTDANGCEQVDTLYLTIKDNPDVQISGNTNIFEGQSTVLTAISSSAQSFEWSTGSNTNVLSTGALTASTTYTVTVTAENGCTDSETVIVNVTPCNSWQLVTDESQLGVGDQIVITNTNADRALSTEQRTNNRGSVAITSNGNTISINDNVQVIYLEQGTVENTFAFNVGSGYLYAASSSANHLKTQASNDANGSWKVEIDPNGNATIKAQGTNTRNWLRYHIPGGGGDSVHLFSCYATGQEDVLIYKLTSIHSDTTAIACGSFTWHGTTYTTSCNIDYHTTSLATGCDSTVTLHLTIKPAPSVQISTLPDPAAGCEGESVVLTATTSCGGTEVILEEGFDGLTGNSSTTGGSNDTINISDLPNLVGANKVYQAGDAIRIGTSSNTGSIKTINLPLSSNFTISIFAKKWVNATKNTHLVISAGSQSQTITVSTPDYTEQQIHFNGETSSTQIEIKTTSESNFEKRSFIDSISVTRNAPCVYSWYTTSGSFSSDLSTTVTPLSTGWYYFSATSPEGCVGVDSVLVVVNEPTVGDTSATACDSFTWYGQTYNTSGSYEHTIVGGNAAGCDSVVTLHLTVNQSTASSTPVTACDSYEWNGTTYTASGTYTYNTTNAAGCDSTATLVLTVNQSTASSTPVTACDSYE